MSSNANVREFAEQLSAVYEKIEDAKCEERAIIDAAKEAGINPRSLKKVAKELGTDSRKLAKRYADEEQLDMFRAQVGIFKRKGLDDTDKAAAAAKVAGEKALIKAAEDLDAFAGSDIAGSYKRDKKKVNAYVARTAEQ